MIFVCSAIRCSSGSPGGTSTCWSLSRVRPGWLVGRAGRAPVVAGSGGGRPGARRRPRLRFADRVLVTLAHLRPAIPHETLTVAFEVDRSTVTRAIGQIRPLLANRGCALPSGIRLRTLADVVAYAAAEGVTLRLDA